MSKQLPEIQVRKLGLLSRAASPDEEAFKTWAKKKVTHDFEDVSLHFLASIDNGETRETYFHSLKVFSAWAGDLDIRDITPTFLVGWREAQKRREMKPATIRKGFSAISSLLRYAMGLELIEKNAVDLLGKKRNVDGEETRTESLSQEEMARVLSYLSDKCIELEEGKNKSRKKHIAWQTFRLRHAFVAVMAYAIARVTSVTTLRMKDFVLSEDGWRLHLRAKGGKFLKPLINDELSQILISYIRDFRDGASEEESLFISVKNLNIPSSEQTDIQGHEFNNSTQTFKPLTRQAAHFWLSELMKEVELSHKLHPHVIRTSGINALRRSGEPIENTQKLAGHENLSTTARYYRVGDGKGEAASLRISYSPKAKDNPSPGEG